MNCAECFSIDGALFLDHLQGTEAYNAMSGTQIGTYACNTFAANTYKDTNRKRHLHTLPIKLIFSQKQHYKMHVQLGIRESWYQPFICDPLSCAAGLTGPAGSCVVCAAGKYSAAGASVCTDCDAGKFQAAAGSSGCTECELGTETSSSGSVSCEKAVTNRQLVR
jgi:hypothetical protein